MDGKKSRKHGTFPLLVTLFSLFCVSLFFWMGVLLFLVGCKKMEESAPVREDTTTFADTNLPGSTNAGTLDPSGTNVSEPTLQTALAEQVLRLHIVADSNSDADQTVKLAVRDAVITYLKPYLEHVTTKNEAMEVISAQMDALTKISNHVLAENGFPYTADAKLGRAYFPVKLYGDLTLPAGEYDALKINLGSASGKNWWCLVFPQLCFVDVTTGVLPEDSKEELRTLLDEEEYALLFPDEDFTGTTHPDGTLSDSVDTSIKLCGQTCRILFDRAPRKTKKPEIRFPLLEQIRKLFSR